MRELYVRERVCYETEDHLVVSNEVYCIGGSTGEAWSKWLAGFYVFIGLLCAQVLKWAIEH